MYTEPFPTHSFPAVPIPHCLCSCWNPCSGHMQSQLYTLKWNKQWWQCKPAAATGNRSHNNIPWSHLPSLKTPQHWLLIFYPLFCSNSTFVFLDCFQPKHFSFVAKILVTGPSGHNLVLCAIKFHSICITLVPKVSEPFCMISSHPPYWQLGSSDFISALLCFYLKGATHWFKVHRCWCLQRPWSGDCITWRIWSFSDVSL